MEATLDGNRATRYETGMKPVWNQYETRYETDMKLVCNRRITQTMCFCVVPAYTAMAATLTGWQWRETV